MLPAATPMVAGMDASPALPPGLLSPAVVAALGGGGGLLLLTPGSGANSRSRSMGQMTDTGPCRVAIACQGGGSHTAFTAGVLKRLLGADELADVEVVGLSGTSGGAVCALLAWSALLDGAPAAAGGLLEDFWADNSATTPMEQLVNAWVLWAARLENLVVLPAVSPYDSYGSVTALDEFRTMLERRVDFGRFQVQADGSGPMLLVGAVDVRSGAFKAFNSRRDRITADMILASAAIPTLFRAVRVGDGTYWDGLFSQNPPVRELVDSRPDELWVIQINPRERDTEPRTMVEIADRRNELSGNLSLHQELGFIEKIDQLLDGGLLAAAGRYRQITVRVIELTRPPGSRSLGSASKLNRDPGFIRELIDHGEARAAEFLAARAFEDAWRRRDPAAVLACFAGDAELVSGPPFPDRGVLAGRRQIGRFVREQLTTDLHIDPTRKQVAADGVAWTVRAYRDDPGARVQGRAEARFRDGKVASLRLGG
jgi:NTE family protein